MRMFAFLHHLHQMARVNAGFHTIIMGQGTEAQRFSVSSASAYKLTSVQLVWYFCTPHSWP